ncbi:MAG: hypothetical protein FJX66_11635 [Alphaproteobacteria bacterium]|nr:hypothetical protein [Alphaproteobacteria bacterium]
MNPLAKAELEAAFTRIATDRSHGATELAAAALAALVNSAEALATEGEDYLAACRALAVRVGQLRPSMASLGNWAAAYLNELEARRNGVEPWREAALAIEQRRSDVSRRLVEEVRRLLRPPASRLLTLSYSSTVAQALALLGRPIEIVIGEARPLLEGRKLASAMVEAGHRVTLVTDAALSHEAGQADLVLLGADTIGRDGTAINKTGSFAAALGAKRAGVPVYVVADRYKLEPNRDGRDLLLEVMPGEEIWPEAAGLCRNIYFEPVPADLITAFVMDCGVVAPGALGSLLEEIRAIRRALEPR